jgi:hypothetical protein
MFIEVKRSLCMILTMNIGSGVYADPSDQGFSNFED